MATTDTPKHTNALIHEKSPYLLQHAHNPVNWMPWGEAAIAKARAEQKPILLSSGYSTCHWCHVMEHESFENEATAALMNESFICIKLDREERPDVDLTYMTYVQAATGHGGWPMNVFLTPDLKPFYGGTYYPPESKGRIGWPDLLGEISRLWKEDHAGLLERANATVTKLQQHIESEHADATEPDLKLVLTKAYDDLSGSFDYHEGGFGSAPKFPRPTALGLLHRLHLHLKGKDESQSDWALEMAAKTLRCMAFGGIRDHISGGFHRYSVDGYWHVPHYEKMLYDQGQLLSAYVEGHQLSGSIFFADIAREIATYLKRDMTSPGGAFYSAEDADSLATAESAKKTEGAFFVWSAAEVDELLGKEEGGIFRYYYGIRRDGNARAESDPHGELKGLNTLFRAYSMKKTAEFFKRPLEEIESLLIAGRAKLFEVREKRPRPHLDDKIITAWNGLAIAGLAKSGAELGEAEHLAMATRAAQCLHDTLCDAPGKGLRRSWRDGVAGSKAFAIDYACLIHGLIELHQATLDVKWLQWAEALQAELHAAYWDKKHSGYYSVHTDMPHTVMRIKEDYDGAEPSPNSLAALNLARLASLTARKDYAEQAAALLRLFGHTLQTSTQSVPMMVMGLDFQQSSKQQIVLAGERDSADFQALLRVVQGKFLPHAVVLHADGGAAQAYHGKYNEAIAGMKEVGGHAAAYLCQGETCQPPVTDATVLAGMLSR